MDLSKIFLKRHQKASMGPYSPHTHSTAFFTISHHSGPVSPFYFSPDGGNMPFKSFSYPNCYNPFHLSQENLINNVNQAMDFAKGSTNLTRFPTMNLKKIVGGLIDGCQGILNASQRGGGFENHFENMFDLVTKSVEINRSMSCPEPFSFNVLATQPSSKKNTQPRTDIPVANPPDMKMSYAEVAKMNLSIGNLNRSCRKETIKKASSQKSNVKVCGKKEYKLISPPGYRTVNKNSSCNKGFGTNCLLMGDKGCIKSKPFHPSRNISSKRAKQTANKRAYGSYKREMGTKKNNQIIDVDGSMWSRENLCTEMLEDRLERCPESPLVLARVRSASSESDCSSVELSFDFLKNPRVRSISECSINSIESEDSFIVFDDCTDDNSDYDSYEEDSSSDEDCENHLVNKNCGGSVQAAYLECVNSKWDTLTSERPEPDQSSLDTVSFKPCAVLKKVRFACGEALAKVRNMCVWDFAHRAARIGPWEQAARDRARFSSRILSLSSVLNPILDPCHRSKIYNARFAPT